MTNFFAPTPEDIKEAQNNGRPEFKHNEVVNFLIDEVMEKVDDKGETYLIVGTKVLTGDNEGKKYPFFIRDNAVSKGIFINMLKAFFDDATIAGGQLSPASLVSRMMSSTCKESAGKDGKIYYNFYEFSELGGVPDIGGAPATANTASQAPAINPADIPF